ncbi:MAG: nicotinate-nucleotide adenylyltransferase [Bacteroidetes bacterium]|nr:nicotinate-nucleotide adenylyltransferase [Bacteroidota bacterium]
MRGKDKNRIGLFFGSFNPIHIGHLMIASYMVEFTDLSRVWFVVSPHNPLKEKNSLLAGHHRLAMVNLAIEEDPRFLSSGIEFHLPQPSYTIDTLYALEEKYSDKQFVIIAGTDFLPDFHRWKDHETLAERFDMYIYPRPGSQDLLHSPEKFPRMHRIAAPLLEISSSFLRQNIRERKDVRYFLPEKVYRYIREMHFYEDGSNH